MLMEEDVLYSITIFDPDDQLISPDQDHEYLNVNSDTDLWPKFYLWSWKVKGKMYY